MTSEEFTERVKQFLESHGFSLDRKDRVEKFHGEVGEFIRAMMYETEADQRGEAIDCGVTAWCLMLAYGVEDPFAAMLAKLEEAAERPHYREMRERTKEKANGNDSNGV